MLGRLFPVDGQWYEWRQEPALPAVVLVRISPGDDGRLLLTGLRIDGAPTAELLRTIPVGRIEATANAQLAVIVDPIPGTGADAGTGGGGRGGGAVVVERASHPRPVADDPALGWETTDPQRALPRPPGGGVVDDQASRRGRPDAFYEEIASAYLRLAQVSLRPAADLADTHAVPVTTAHRWIKEARRRRLLPPGRPGKAG